MLRFDWSDLLGNLVQIGLTVSAAALVLCPLLPTMAVAAEMLPPWR